MERERLIIGIAGGSGSGKTTLTDRLARCFDGEVTVVSHDDYYRARDDLSMEERRHINYDHPNAFETELLVEHLRRLRRGEAVECPSYDYVVHNRRAQTHTLWPRRVILVEGILIFENPELCREMDVKVFVDTDSDVRLLRRIGRDINERGRTLSSVEEQYLATVKPMYDKYIRNYVNEADVIVARGGKNARIVDILAGYVQDELNKRAQA